MVKNKERILNSMKHSATEQSSCLFRYNIRFSVLGRFHFRKLSLHISGSNATDYGLGYRDSNRERGGIVLFAIAHGLAWGLLIFLSSVYQGPFSRL
jgi:hypothetical protein